MKLRQPRFMFAIVVSFLCPVSMSAALAQGSAFTYQGRLVENGNLANGSYDLQFKLFDTATVGTGTQ